MTKIGQKRTIPKKGIPKQSKKKISTMKRKVWGQFTKYIRYRDNLKATGSIWYGECFTCGEPKEFHQLDAGHFVPKHNSNLFSEHGVHAQCRRCNRMLSGSQLAYRRHLVELYGEEETNRLEFENKETKKFTVEELDGLYAHYFAEVKRLEMSR